MRQFLDKESLGKMKTRAFPTQSCDRQALSLLAAIAAYALESLSTTIDEDEELLSKNEVDNLSMCYRLAVQWRLLHKRSESA